MTRARFDNLQAGHEVLHRDAAQTDDAVADHAPFLLSASGRRELRSHARRQTAEFPTREGHQ